MTNEVKFYFWLLFGICIALMVDNHLQRRKYVDYIDQISDGIVELRRQNDLLVKIINGNN